jgi:uroporphyrinogen decarboxylase
MVAERAVTTSLERTLTALGHSEPDRVPVFLLLTSHGARELRLPIREYFAEAAHVVEAQLRLRERLGHDCLYGFFYAPIEVEAFGAEVIYREDGPPNSGAPILTSPEQIRRLSVPVVRETPCLVKVLEAIHGLKAEARDEVPIVGVVMSPFSLPVMQLGFDHYLDLIHEEPDLLWRLAETNQELCVEWANAQLEAGATAICYFDPVSSTTIIPPALYRRTGLPIARQTLGRIAGPTVTHMASGRCLPIIDDIKQTGTKGVAVSVDEDLTALKRACGAELTVIGNLNGIEMRRWTPAEAEARAKQAIAAAARGGGYILSDNHGEIPAQVPDEVLRALVDATRRWGRYPLDWLDEPSA